MLISKFPHARISSVNPRAFAICDKCGFVYNHMYLRWSIDWQGPRLLNRKMLVCETCYDKPQEQKRTIVIPADPIPIYDPRPEQYDVEVPSFLATEGSVDIFETTSGILDLLTEDDDSIVSEIEDTPNPDPDNPVDYP